MSTDEEKDPPVPAYLEGISLKRVHDSQVAEDSCDTTPLQADGKNS